MKRDVTIAALMRKGYFFLRCLGYLAGILGAVCLFVFRDQWAWAERVGLGLLGVMFISFLFSFVLFVWIKLDGRGGKQDAK